MANSGDALAVLRDSVKVGWRVEILDHMYTKDSRPNVTVTAIRDGVLTLTSARPWASQGRRFYTTELSWDRGDFEVSGRLGRTFTYFRTPTSITSRTTPGVRQAVKTYIFSPPVG